MEQIIKLVVFSTIIAFIGCKSSSRDDSLECCVNSVEINFLSENFLKTPKSQSNIVFNLSFKNISLLPIKLDFSKSIVDENNLASVFLISINDSIFNLKQISPPLKELVVLEPDSVYIAKFEWKTFDPYIYSLRNIGDMNSFLKCTDYEIRGEYFSEKSNYVKFTFSKKYKVGYLFNYEEVDENDSIRMGYINKIPLPVK